MTTRIGIRESWRALDGMRGMAIMKCQPGENASRAWMLWAFQPLKGELCYVQVYRQLIRNDKDGYQGSCRLVVYSGTEQQKVRLCALAQDPPSSLVILERGRMATAKLSRYTHPHENPNIR